MVVIRREELIIALGRAPPMSAGHCGNHIQNLIDVIVTAVCDASLSPVLASGAAFFKMGRNFLRLLHALPTWTRDRTPPVAMGACWPLAKALDEKLEDYATRSFMGFTDAQRDEAWSSDSDTERRLESLDLAKGDPERPDRKPRPESDSQRLVGWALDRQTSMKAPKDAQHVLGTQSSTQQLAGNDS